MALGRKTGGRAKGTPNKCTDERKLILQEAKEETKRALLGTLTPEQIDALSPKDVLIHVMRRALAAGSTQLAIQAASAAAPYVHPRLAQTELNAHVRRSLTDLSDAELAAIASSRGGEEGDGEATSRPH